MKRRILSLYRLSLPFATAILALLARPSAQAQSWSGATSGAWLTTGNWTGAVAAGSSTITTDTDIAVFNVAANATVGINMSTTSGAYYLGALDITNATARTFNNSSTTVAGVLTLNGAVINSVANTILRNTTTALMTITNGTGVGTLGLGLGNTTNNVIQITGTGGITINSIISGTGRNLTRQGAGTGALTLTGANTYTGTTTITAGTLSINTFTNGGVAGSLGMASNAPANLVMEGGTLSYSGGSTTTDRGMTFSALTGNPIINVSTAATNLTLTNVIVGTSGQQIDFTKGGGGTLTLSNDNNS
jgi:fibronectin-binding autotransporter adhesin